MKLAGPQLGYRVILGLTSSRVVIRGCFPPELAPLVRQIMQQGVDAAHPQLLAAYQKMVDDDIQRMIHGDPDAPAPRGILGRSPVADMIDLHRHDPAFSGRVDYGPFVKFVPDRDVGAFAKIHPL